MPESAVLLPLDSGSCSGLWDCVCLSCKNVDEVDDEQGGVVLPEPMLGPKDGAGVVVTVREISEDELTDGENVGNLGKKMKKLRLNQSRVEEARDPSKPAEADVWRPESAEGWQSVVSRKTKRRMSAQKPKILRKRKTAPVPGQESHGSKKRRG